MVLCVPVQLLFQFQTCVVWRSSLWGNTARRPHSILSFPFCQFTALCVPVDRGSKWRRQPIETCGYMRVRVRQLRTSSFPVTRSRSMPHGHLWRSPCGRRGRCRGVKRRCAAWRQEKAAAVFGDMYRKCGLSQFKAIRDITEKKRQSIKSQTAASRDSAFKSVAVSQIAYFH